jgi:hypothetical protein
MEQLQKNATIGPLAGIEPGALRSCEVLHSRLPELQLLLNGPFPN